MTVTSTVHLLSVYSRQASKIQAEIGHALTTRASPQSVASLFDKQSALVHSLIRELKKGHDKTLQAHTARVAVLSSLEPLATGLTWMANGYRSQPARPSAESVKNTTNDFKKAGHWLQLAKHESVKARELLGCHDTCSILV